MTFTDSQQQLKQARTQRHTAEMDLFKSREKLNKVRREKSRLSRYAAGNKQPTGAIDDRLEALAAKEEQVLSQLAKTQGLLTKMKQAELALSDEFLSYSDPREHISQLDDDTPIVLFPLRIETRFKTLPADPGTATTAPVDRHQLWVRVYPDDIAIDSFESLLSENEVNNAARYYASMWVACSNEEKERAAWRSLVASHGSGRAYWITQNYQPVNEGDKPEKDNSEDVVLVIATDDLPAESEQDVIKTYWHEFWFTRENAEQQQAAWDNLLLSVGEERAGEIVENYKPANINEPVPESVELSDVNLDIVFLQLHKADGLADELDTTLSSWSQMPKTNIMPERLILLAYNDGSEEPVVEEISHPIPDSLATGPDPSAEESDQIRLEDGNIIVNEAMEWVVDFNQAIVKGMGFRIDLTPAQALQGFDRLIVLGVRLGDDKDHGKQALETLLEHHHHSRKGLSILPQGTATNNTEKDGAGFSWREDSDVSFNQYFKADDLTDPTDWYSKKDGRWLAETLGIDPGKLQNVAHYYHTDQCEARAMNRALWPATMGYFMENMMEPVFEDKAIVQTREFFNRFVSGRGMIPAIRVGRQPYGILPATPFSRMQWLSPKAGTFTHLATTGSGSNDFLYKLYRLLRKIEADWSSLLDQVSYVGKEGDAHQILLDIVGLHPNSVEFYSRNAQSFEQLYNTLNLKGLGGAFIALLIAAGYTQSGLDLLAEFGYTPEDPTEDTPEILRKFFFTRGDLLNGPMIDDVPLSEIDPVRFYTDDSRNYMQWLIDTANESHDSLRKQQDFTDNQPPSALLYLMLHHALDLGYIDTSLRLHVKAELLTQPQMMAARKDPNFIHIQQQVDADAGSRWQYLYKADARITNNDTLLIAHYIPRLIGTAQEARNLSEQLEALEHLKHAPTARLERVFVEHLDSCTYRHDAWMSGLVNYQLASMRNIHGESDPDDIKQGVYIGAYGWLEDVRPENKQLEPVDLEPDLEDIFTGSEQLMTDNTNAGYIHAPSVNHAVTAAVLRNGYLENGDAENPDSLAINLSSERVRLALGIIEGMQAGQGLSELLGYQLERGLHDRQDVEVDSAIFDLRFAFPLRANHIVSTKDTDADAIDQIEAKNVIDALALIEQIHKSGNENYPFGSDKLPVDLPGAQQAAINEEVQRILNINDAVADLAIAESVHQVVQGNYDRAAATLDTYSKGHFPPIPDVIKTPRSGVTLTHRVGLQLISGLSPADVSLTTPRAKAEPALNQWLSTVLPDLANIACRVIFTDTSDAEVVQTISLSMLGYLPIDALYAVNLESDQAMTLIDDAICLYIYDTFNPKLDSDIHIRYTESIVNKLSLHEVAPLIRSVKNLVQQSRALNAGDVSIANETSKAMSEASIHLDHLRITLNRDGLDNAKIQLENYISGLEPLVDSGNVDTIIPEIDNLISELANIFQSVAMFGLPQSGMGFMWEWQRSQYQALSSKINDLIVRWEEKLVNFDSIIADYDALPGTTSDEEKFTLLQSAEWRITTIRADITSLTPDGFRNDLVNTVKPAFEQQLNDVRLLLSSTQLSDYYADVQTTAQTTIPDFDLTAFDIKDELKQLSIFAQDLLADANNLLTDVQGRLTSVDDLLTQHDESITPKEKVNALLDAGKLLFGEDFKIIPEFELSELPGNEWQNSFEQQHQNQLLSYQTDTLEEDFPVDNWLYGIARVREKMSHVENAILMTESLANAEIPLTPIQLPYNEEDYWLALEYPDNKADDTAFRIDEDKLLYTAHYAEPFNKDKAQCGLLIDEWTEVIPGEDETSGLTFHYDRPNSEPPQTLLLVTPAAFTGSWRWDDVVDSLHDTLDMAKQRAIEPGHIDTTSYARFLPALVSSMTVYPITAALNLALNNQFYLFEDNDDE